MLLPVVGEIGMIRVRTVFRDSERTEHAVLVGDLQTEGQQDLSFSVQATRSSGFHTTNRQR